MHTEDSDIDIIFKMCELMKDWYIEKDGVLIKYKGKNKENVVVPDIVKAIVSNPFPETIETLKMPKSLIELNPGINAKKVHIFGNTKIDFSVVNVRETIEELIIYNSDNEETILNNLEQKIEKPYYLTKLKRITLRGKPIKEEYNEKFEILKEKLSKLDIDLTLPKEFEIIDGVLKAYNGEDTNIIIPEGVRIIDANVFRGRNLTSVILPESLETIRDNAFADNNLEKIVIPSNVNFISYSAFLNNPNLKTIEMSVENNLSFSMPYTEHLILNSSFRGNAIDIKTVLKNNKAELIKLKKLTIRSYRNLCVYGNLKLILNKENIRNLDLTIENNNSIITYTFINNNLNSIRVEKGLNHTDFEALGETYKLYINNTNENTIRDFIEHINYYGFKPRNLGMIIIKGENISLREKLALNKALGKIIFYSFEPSKEIEQKEETIELNNTIEDEEISKLLTEINSILNTNTNTEDKNKILMQINNIINKYKQNLTKIKPKLFNEKSKFGEEELTPDSLRINLILELNNILNRLKNNNIYINLRKTITEFETLTQSKDLQTPEKIETLEDKVKYIISKSNEKYNFINELRNIFKEINRLISNSIITFKNDIKLVSDAPIDKTLDKKVDTLYEEVKRIFIIEETFNNDNSELAKDIKILQKIISNFSIEHQNIFNEKLNSIINKYYQELISGQRKDLNETILEIRKVWHPLLEELNLKSFIYTKYKELIDELNSEKNDKVSTIEILINEINNLKDSSNLDNETKIEINNKLEKIISSWKNKLINNYEIKEKIDPLEDIFKNYNLTYIPKLKINNICIEIEIQITKELINLKNEILTYIQEKEEYEKLTKVMKNIKISG